MDNHYDTLRIESFSSFDTIRSAFIKLSKKFHPDCGGNQFMFHDIRKAYKALCQESKRQEYDKQLRIQLAYEKKERKKQSISEFTISEKIEIILAWSTTHKTFDISFTSNCLDRISKGLLLTEKQEKAIENILMKFNINLEDLKDERLRMDLIEKLFNSQKEMDRD